MWLKNRQKYKPELTVDIHSHILPDVDDGCRTFDDSLTVLRKMAGMGIKTVYATPHVKSSAYPNTPQTLMPVYRQLCEALENESIQIEVRLAAEYYMDDAFFSAVNTGEELLTFPNNHILVENPMRQEPLFVYDLVFKLQSRGYIPILAHPERYPYYFSSPDSLRKLRHAGFLFQVNLLSFKGFYGKRSMETAMWLVKNNMVDFVGSDVHSPDQADFLNDPKIWKTLSGVKVSNEILI